MNLENRWERRDCEWARRRPWVVRRAPGGSDQYLCLQLWSTGGARVEFMLVLTKEHHVSMISSLISRMTSFLVVWSWAAVGGCLTYGLYGVVTSKDISPLLEGFCTEMPGGGDATVTSIANDPKQVVWAAQRQRLERPWNYDALMVT